MISLLFDLDDTLLTYDGVSSEAWKDACEKYRVANHDSRQIHETINKISEWFWSDAERHRNGRLDIKNARRQVVSMAFDELNIVDCEETAINLADHFSELREKLMQPFPQAIETLEHLKKKHFPMGLITNGSEDVQKAKIIRFNLARFFDVILIEGAFGKGKPEKDVFLHALDKLGASPENTYMIGDSIEYDIEGAKPLGIRTIWHNWSNRQPVSGPDYTIKSIPEILPIIFNHEL